MSMRNLKVAIVVAAFAMMASSAQAQLLVEHFAYPNGALVGQGIDGSHLWVSHSGVANQMQVSSGAAMVVQATQSEDVSVPMGITLGSGGKIFAAFDVTVTAQGALSGTSPAYFAHFKDTTTTNFASRVFAAPSTVGGDFTYGIRSFSGTGPAISWASGFTLGTTQRLVMSYDFNSGEGRLWVNPANIGSTSIGDTNALAVNFAMSFFALREASYSTANGVQQKIDELCIDTDFDKALTCLPEPSTLALFGLGALALVRRRR